MNTPIEINTEGNRIVYVKTVEVSGLPREVREQAGDLDQLYAVHDSDGSNWRWSQTASWPLCWRET